MGKNFKHIKFNNSNDGLIGYVYYDYGKIEEQGTEERKNLFLKGITYFRTGLRVGDSLGIPKNKFILDRYLILKLMYGEIGDLNNQEFFDKKYNDLYFLLTGHSPTKS